MLCRLHIHHPGSQKCQQLLTRQSAALVTSASPWKPRMRHKRTRQSPHHQRLQQAHTHWPVLRVGFTPPSVSKTWYCEVLIRPGEASQTKPSVISKEKKHLSPVLVSNGYPSSFLQKITKTKREPVTEFKSTVVLPYVQGLSEPPYNNKSLTPHLGHT